MNEIFEKIKYELDKLPESSAKRVILVVPAQASLYAEKKAFEYFTAKGFFDFRIVRGKKLMEAIMTDTFFPSETQINSIGRNMILRKIAKNRKDDLRSFGSICESDEFTKLATDSIRNLKQSGCSSDEFESFCRNLVEGTMLNSKLCDLSMIYSDYEKYMSGRFSDSENLLDFVIDRIPQSSFIKDSVIFFYGFYSFTKQEIEYLKQLSKYSRGLCVALENGSEEAFEIIRKTQAKLSDAGLAFISCKMNEAFKSLKTPLRIMKCAGPFTQALSVAADIKKLVREKGLLYDDIAVFSPENSDMQSQIKRVFSMLDIPLFIDDKRTVLHSSGIEALSALFDIVCGDCKRSDVIRLFKSGIFRYSADEIDLFDNYTESYHIKSAGFFKAFKYGKKKYTAAEFDLLEEMRSCFASLAQAFIKDFSDAVSVKDKTSVLFDFISEKLQMPEKLRLLSLKQAENGFADAAEENAQVWDSIISVMDQMVELTGAEIQTNDEYTQSFTSALKDIKIGVLPQAEGKVTFGNLTRSFAADKKAVYIIGFNDNLVPCSSDKSGILTESERLSLQGSGIGFGKDSKALLEEELFNLERILSCASDQLCICWCSSDCNGGELKPSILLPSIEKRTKADKTADITDSENGLDFLEGKELTNIKLIEKMRSYAQGEQLTETWKEIYNQLRSDNKAMQSGLRYSKENTPLKKELVSKLFATGSTLSFSPSRLDTFASCPFKHFINYGLRPLQDEDFSIGATQLGTIHHDVLLALCRKLSESSISGNFPISDSRSLWMSIDDKTLEELINSIFEQLTANSYDGIMTFSKEDEYKSGRIKSTCKKFAKQMIEQVRHSVINEMYFEQDFKRGAFLPPICIDTASGPVYIEGRIDRIDISPKDGDSYVKIIDYKSGNISSHKDLADLGLQLQLMTYLEGAEGKFESQSAGVYYFHIKDPGVAAKLEDLPSDEIAESVKEKIEKEYKLDGFEVDTQFREKFRETLSKLCIDLVGGNIQPQQKKYKSIYDSCKYCNLKSVCLKDLK